MIYILPVHVGGWRLGKQILSFEFGVTQILAFFDTNMLVFPTRNCGVWGSKPTRGPNANGFASQWNIGLMNSGPNALIIRSAHV